MILLLLTITVIFARLQESEGYNDYPSLMAANATMAVIIEKGFFEEEEDHQKTLRELSDNINSVIKKYMNISGIAVTIFGDLNVKLNHDFTVLFSIATCLTTWNLYDRAHKEKLVHLAITDPDCPRLPEDAGISLPLIDPGKELPQIFLDMRLSNIVSWAKINVIHDDTFARDTISRVVKALSLELPNKRVTLSARALFSTKFDRNEVVMKQRIRKILSGFHVDQLGSTFIAIVTVDMVSSIIEVAKELKLAHPQSQWLYVISEGVSNSTKEANVTSFIDQFSEGENIAFVYNSTSSDCDMGLKCHVNEMMRALAVSLEHSLLSELQLYDRVTEEEFEYVRLTKAERKQEIIRSMNLELASVRLSAMGSCGDCLNWRLVSALTWGTTFGRDAIGKRDRHQQESKSQSELIDSGSWNLGSGIRMVEPLFPHVVQGFRGKILPISTFHNPPWVTIKYSNTGEREEGGLIFDIVNHLSLELNFTYSVQVPAGFDEASRFLKANTSTVSKGIDVAAMSVAHKLPPEIVNLVRSKQVFIAALALTVAENEFGVNFTASIATQSYALLSVKPKPQSRALLFMAPFTTETWICLIVSVIVVGPFLYLTVRLSPRPKDWHEKSGLTSIWQCSWYVYGALLQQGGMALPKTDSSRIIVGTWWLAVIVVVSTYSGSLIAFLTFPRMNVPIESVDDLLERDNEFHWAYPNGSAFGNYLEAAAKNEDKYKRLLDGAQMVDPLKPLEALDRIKLENLVLIDWRSSLAFLMGMDLIKTDSCSLHLGSEDFMNEELAMIIAEESPYIHLVNDAIKKMHESGLIQKWTSEKMPMKDKCWESSNMNQEATNHKVNMGDMQGIFYVLAIGIAVAALFISIEYLWYRRKLALEKNFIRPFVS